MTLNSGRLAILFLSCSVLAGRPGSLLGQPVGVQSFCSDTPYSMGRWGSQFKGRPEAPNSDLKALAWARLEAAQGETAARWADFLQGRGTLVISLDAARRWLESAQAVCIRNGERLAVLEQYWRLARAYDDINTSRYRDGRISLEDHMLTRCTRLEAETWLADMRERHKQPATPAPGIHSPWATDNAPADSFQLLTERFVQRSVARKELVLARSEAVRRGLTHAYRGWLEGRPNSPGFSDDPFYGWSVRFLDAERELDPGRQVSIASLKRHWLATRGFHEAYQVRFLMGRISVDEYQHALFKLLEAAIWLKEGMARPAPPRPPEFARLVISWSDDAESVPLSSIYVQNIAKANFDLLHSDVKQLAQAKMEAARSECLARKEDFLAGRGMLALLHLACRRWLESQLAIGDSAADRLTALQRHWELAKQIEVINQERYQAKPIPIQDLLQTRYERLDAELRFAQTRQRQAKAAPGH
jgi:hypothetical protein